MIVIANNNCIEVMHVLISERSTILSVKNIEKM